MTIEDDEGWRENPTGEHPKAKAPTSRPPLRVVGAGERDTRIDIRLTTRIHETTEHMMSALRSDPELYVRSGSLAHVIRAEETVAGIQEGSPVTRAAPLSWLADRVSVLARCVVPDKKGVWRAATPPMARVKAVQERGSWPGMRTLTAIIETPSMRPDGTILQEPGYDPATRYLYEPNASFPAVPDEPTQADCMKALAELAEPFADFPYVNEAHRYAAISAVLTLLARPGIQGSVPCFLLDASAARSGKSLQVDVMHLIATGRPASRMTYPEQDEELEKVLAGYALRGASTVNFDNVARKFGGAALDKCITAIDKVDLRILGAPDLVTVDWRAVVFASGNNVECRGDMLARVLSPRIETDLDNPETRADLKHPNLRAWVLENRVRLAVAGLTIVRGYVHAGRPDMGCSRWGGFESWSQLIPHAIVWAGGVDPMGARRGLAGDDDPLRAAASVLVEGWASMCNGLAKANTGVSVREALSLLFPPRGAHDPQVPDGHDDLREAIESLTDAKPGTVPSARRLGDILRRQKGRRFNGKKLFAPPPGDGRVAKWRVVAG